MGRSKARKPASIDVIMNIEDDEPEKVTDPYEGLNEAQRTIVSLDEGKMLACSCPGSGKTRSVVNRVYRMVRDGVSPGSILATTFTKKAAGEMNDRLTAMGCPGGARVGTFHSVCLEIIRDGSPWFDFEVDGKDSMRYALKDILGFRGMDWKGADLTEVGGFISACKNALVEPEDVVVRAGPRPSSYREPGVTCDSRFQQAYFLHEEERERRGLLTFDDMLCSSVAYLRSDKNALGRWSGRYAHVIVDEFQDTNRAQYELMKILSDGSASLLAVADDDQLIYAFRGSIPEFTLTFGDVFNAGVVRMETNYRSVPEIIEHANKVIAFNENRVVKTGVAARDSVASNVVEFREASDMDAEAETVVERIMELHEDGVEYKSMSILYRCNAQSRSFEEQLIKRKIPHVVVGGVNFYKRKEVADILAYLRVAVNEGDDNSCERAINRPFRFIGKVSLEAMKEAAEERDVTMFSIAVRASELTGVLGLKPRQILSVGTFVDAVRSLKKDLDDVGVDLPQALSRLVAGIKYEEWIVTDEGTDTAENSRLSNIRELLRTSGRFKSAKEMLEYIDKLVMKKRKEGGDFVQLMTCHRAKGLEWPAVFVVGCSEGILPHGRSDDVESERRIFYVAITRAKDRLMVTCPRTALVRGKTVDLPVSRFVGEAGLVTDKKVKIEPVRTMTHEEVMKAVKELKEGKMQ